MRAGMRRALTAATLAVAATATSLVAAGPASADLAQCPNDNICFYEHANFEGVIHPIPEVFFENCARTTITDGWISSVYNNTDVDLDLWDTSAAPDYPVGTAVQRTSYDSIHPRGNDAIDMVIGIGCWPIG